MVSSSASLPVCGDVAETKSFDGWSDGVDMSHCRAVAAHGFSISFSPQCNCCFCSNAYSAARLCLDGGPLSAKQIAIVGFGSRRSSFVDTVQAHRHHTGSPGKESHSTRDARLH